MSELIHCIKCKRAIPEPDVNDDKGIVYCHGCNYYFPYGITSDRTRLEITVPHGTSTLRLPVLFQL